MADFFSNPHSLAWTLLLIPVVVGEITSFRFVSVFIGIPAAILSVAAYQFPTLAVANQVSLFALLVLFHYFGVQRAIKHADHKQGDPI